MAYRGKRLLESEKEVYVALSQVKRRNHRKKKWSSNLIFSSITSLLVVAVTISSFAMNSFGQAAEVAQPKQEVNETQLETLSLIHQDAMPLAFKTGLTVDNMITDDMVINDAAVVEEEEEPEGVTTTRLGVVVNSYDPNTDYTALIDDCYSQITDKNTEHILGLCEVYETQRNLKVEDMYADDERFSITHTFTAENTAEEIDDIVNPSFIDYTEEDLIQLACIVYAEAGSSWITDEHQRDVASVVINRLLSPQWKGDTIYDIVHAPGQYPNTCNNTYYDERALENARYVLENGPISDGVFQANFKQGTEVINVYRYGDNVTYICR